MSALLQNDSATRSPAQRVTTAIQAALQRGVRPWIKPWRAQAPQPLVLPRRCNGLAYRGMNVPALWAAAEAQGFVSPYWLTFRQAVALGGAVRKGERGSYIIYYAERPEPGEDGASEPSPEAPMRRILKGYIVFNAEQCCSLQELYSRCEPAPQSCPGAELRLAELFARVPALVRYGGEQAFYAPGLDLVRMPPKSAFPDPSLFWATLAHELAHWTRHESRLNRDFGQTRFGDPGYALEELTAELASAFVGAVVGLPAAHLEDHASYIGAWLKALHANPSAFLTAAGKAQAAADFLLRLMGVRLASEPDERAP